jgi:hypothetical protein
MMVRYEEVNERAQDVSRQLFGAGRWKSLRRGASRVETLIGVVVLLLLVGIACAILVKQAHYNPEIIRPTLAAPGEQGKMNQEQRVSGEEAQGAFGVQESAAAENTADATSGEQPAGESVLSRVAFPADVKPLGPPERFDATTLSDKIDGRAEFYLEIGFEQLETRRYQLGAEANRWFEAFVYRMKSPVAGFAAWSGQRRSDAEVSREMPLAYGTANAVYFVCGRWYVELVAGWSGFGKDPRAWQCARALREQLAGGEQETDIAAILPTEGRVAGSERLILKDAFGFAKLDNVILADYLEETTTLTLFVSLRASEEEAAALAKAYHAYLTQEMGADDASPKEQADGILVARALGEYEIIAHCGKRLVGVHAAKLLDAAVAMVKRQCSSSAKGK